MAYTNKTYETYSRELGPQSIFYNDTTNGIDNTIIFEFTAINVSHKLLVYPNFENTSIDGFRDVSANAQYAIPATTLDKLFYFQGYDLSTNTVTPANYGINMDYRFNISYSNASLTYGAINKTTTIPILKADYVNYLAYAITGGYNLADIFDNEQALLDGVTAMNTSFNNTINFNISSIDRLFSTANSSVETLNGSSVFLDDLNNESIYVQGCKSLLDGLLSIANTSRGMRFLNDIEDQNDDPNNLNASATLTSFYHVKFHPGDKLSLLLNYVPFNGNGNPLLGTNPVYTRPYKITLLCN